MALIKTNEQIEEEDILWREQMHDAEFDYLDMQINRTEKIKQKGQDKVLTKKNAAAAGPTKEEQQKILKEQNRLKQLRIQEKKRIKEEEAEQLQAVQMHNERLQMDKRMLAEFNKTTEEEKKNADECDWEDLY
jgi:hypothetical protein